MNKKFVISIFVFLLIIMAFLASAYSQANKSHETGRLWLTMFPVGSMSNYAPLQNQVTFPGGDFKFQTRKNMEGLGLWIGVKNWTNKLKEQKPFYVSEGGYLNNKAPGILYPLKNKKYVRQLLPMVDVDDSGDERLLDTRQSSSRNKKLDADEKIVTTWATDVGIEVTRTSYAFANSQHDSYIIQEFVFKNNGNVDDTTQTIELQGQALEGVWFAYACRPSNE